MVTETAACTDLLRLSETNYSSAAKLITASESLAAASEKLDYISIFCILLATPSLSLHWTTNAQIQSLISTSRNGKHLFTFFWKICRSTFPEKMVIDFL